jgi:predicted dehydrogenase
MANARAISRRDALRYFAGAGFAVPSVFRACAAGARPIDTLNHASFGANGMALADIGSLTASKNLRLVAVADVDLDRTTEVRKRFPEARIYQDWRTLLDKEKDLHSVNVSTPDHMHAPITMRAMQQGLHVYTQKPLTQTIYEARQLTTVARERRIISQMGIQIHAHEAHRTVVATLQAGTIGPVSEVHSWSDKQWGDRNPRPDRRDSVPKNFNWDHWLGVAADRPFLARYYHPEEWRKRLDFGTGTFGDMGCHILDPVFTALELTAPLTVRAESGAVNTDSWGLDCHVQYTFPGTKHTADRLTLTWYDGTVRPPAKVRQLIGDRRLSGQGSIYVGTEGRVLYSPYIANPILLPLERFRDHRWNRPPGQNHYLQFVEACRGNGQTQAPFSFSGNLTESVLLGCLSTRFVKTALEWNAAKLTITNNKAANALVRKEYRKGWEVRGL